MQLCGIKTLTIKGFMCINICDTYFFNEFSALRKVQLRDARDYGVRACYSERLFNFLDMFQILLTSLLCIIRAYIPI